MRSADPDLLPPPRRPVRRRAGAVRAARVLVRQLEWLHWPMVWWGGGDGGPIAPPPDAVHPTDPVSLVSSRLRGRPAGAYAVRLQPAEPAAPPTPGVESLLTATAPALIDIVPVDEPALARALRRLMRARAQFPRALPAVVGDVDAWHASAEAALKRLRPLIPPRKPTPAELLAIEASATWLAPGDRRPSRTLDAASLRAFTGDAGSPAFSRAAAVVLGQRKLDAKPPGLRDDYRCGRLLADWPLDVVAQAAEAISCDEAHDLPPLPVLRGRAGVRAYSRDRRDQTLTPTLSRSTGRGGKQPPGHTQQSPAAALARAATTDARFSSPEAATFVRDALLVGGLAAARRAVAGFPALATIIDRLCDEPRHRLGKLAAAQRDAVARAVEVSGVHGAVFPQQIAEGPAQRRAAMRVFQRAYDDAAASVASGKPFKPAAAYRRAAAPPANRPAAEFQSLLGARRLWEHFLGDAPPSPVALSRQVHWLTRDRTVRFESLPALSANLIWDNVGPALDHFAARLRTNLWSLAARLPTDADARSRVAAMTWVEACCNACRPGAAGDAHADAAVLGLLQLGGSVETLEVLASLAGLLTGGWSDRQGTPQAAAHDRSVLLHHLAFIRAATAAGLDAALIKHVLRRGWMGQVRAVLTRRPERLAAALRWLRRLDLDHPPSSFDHALVLLDADVLDDFVRAVAATSAEKHRAINCVLQYLFEDVEYTRLSQAREPDPSTARRCAFLRAVPQVLAALPRFAPPAGKGRESRLRLWQRAAAVARAWFELGYDDPAAVFDAAAASEDGPVEPRLLHDRERGDELRDVVSLTLGRRDRLLALRSVPLDLNYQELDWMAAAWRWMEPLGAWRDLISALACNAETGKRTTRLLARLGLCLRLHRGAALRGALGRMLDGADPPPHLAAALDELGAADDLRQALGRLCALREKLPRAVELALTRREALAAELRALERAAPPPAAAERVRARVDNLRRYLDDRIGLRQWVESDLRKLVGPAVGAAALESAERLAERVIRDHATGVVGAAPPAGADARNWDNAIRLYVTIDRNRATLRKLLRGEATGDRTWVTRHAANRRFLDAVAARGVDLAAWRGPFARTYDTPAGTWTVALETDPLHVLQMGNYFGTCLALDGVNAFSTVANACEADKRVAYVRDARGAVIGRKLLLLTPLGRLVGFRSYGAGALDEWEALGEARGPGPWVKVVLDVFSRELADRCGARLHPLVSRGKPFKDDPHDVDRGLFCRWYNDGPEPFDPPWLRHSPAELRRQLTEGGPARDELDVLRQGDETQRAAAARVGLWFGVTGFR